ncbi:hypothetical protein J3E68DRAFT_172140 [Trichoderma sp. SZMC 28012]
MPPSRATNNKYHEVSIKSPVLTSPPLLSSPPLTLPLPLAGSRLDPCLTPLVRVAGAPSPAQHLSLFDVHAAPCSTGGTGAVPAGGWQKPSHRGVHEQDDRHHHAAQVRTSKTSDTLPTACVRTTSGSASCYGTALRTEQRASMPCKLVQYCTHRAWPALPLPPPPSRFSSAIDLSPQLCSWRACLPLAL